MSSPIGVPGPTRVKNWFCSSVSIGLLVFHDLDVAACRCVHFRRHRRLGAIFSALGFEVLTHMRVFHVIGKGTAAAIADFSVDRDQVAHFVFRIASTATLKSRVSHDPARTAHYSPRVLAIGKMLVEPIGGSRGSAYQATWAILQHFDQVAFAVLPRRGATLIAGPGDRKSLAFNTKQNGTGSMGMRFRITSARILSDPALKRRVLRLIGRNPAMARSTVLVQWQVGVTCVRH